MALALKKSCFLKVNLKIMNRKLRCEKNALKLDIILPFWLNSTSLGIQRKNKSKLPKLPTSLNYPPPL